MSHRVAVYVALRRGSDVLFMLRTGTGYRDGEYGLPSGKVEPGETLLEGACREVAEETGLVIEPSQLAFGHVMERTTPTGTWLDWFFVCDHWNGLPANKEPAKCAELAWLDASHDAVTDYVRLALGAITGSQPFSAYDGL